MPIGRVKVTITYEENGQIHTAEKTETVQAGQTVFGVAERLALNAAIDIEDHLTAAATP